MSSVKSEFTVINSWLLSEKQMACYIVAFRCNTEKIVHKEEAQEKSVCMSNLKKKLVPVDQHGVVFDVTNHSARKTHPRNLLLWTLWWVLSGLLSLSPLPPPVNRLAAHITGALSYPQPLKTQSLKNKYMMPMAVKQVGVVAVWAFRLTHTDSYSTHRLNAFTQNHCWLYGSQALIFLF